jgi:hypothetical protein
MTNLRIFGIVVGILGLIASFLFFRGPKWKRSNFVLCAFTSFSLTMVSINPDVLNFLRDALSLRESARGRILVLLIISNLFLLFYLFFTKLRVENIRLQFDQLIRSLGARELEKSATAGEMIKPIMVIIPAYNEAENLKEVLTRIPKRINDIEVGVLVVDDASEDNTADEAARLGHLVVANRINRGQGAASRLGYDVLIKNKVSVGVTMDADGQHRPEELERLVAPILEGHYDLVIGSRVLGKSDKNTWIRGFGIALLSRVISMVIPQKITDCSSGYKAFNIDKLRDMKLTEEQFQSAEVLIEASKKGLRIGEVPITINRRMHGSSKKGTNWSYGINFSKTILKTWWRL